jgi:hypothetical protein
MKKGTVRHQASFLEKLEYDKYVLRTVRKGYGYWVWHCHGITWVKLSNQHGDWGYAKSVPEWCRHMHRMDAPAPWAATKLGAIAVLIAELREEITRYGADFVEDYDGDGPVEPALSIKLKKCLGAQRRLRLSSKKEPNHE